MSPPLSHSRSALHRFHIKLKSMNMVIRNLNRTRYGDITIRTKEVFEGYTIEFY